jgi:hypothetical protein
MKLTLSTLLLLLSFFAKSQSNEFQIGVFVNKLSFVNPGAAQQVIVYYPQNTPNSSPIANNPYGTNGKIGYGIRINYQRSTKSKLVFGIASSLEKLKTQAPVSQFNGENILHLNYLNLHPFIGLRLANKELLKLDLKLVTDLSYLLASKEELTFEMNGITNTYTNDRNHQKTDYRLGLGVAVHVQRFSLNMEYLVGIVNHNPQADTPFHYTDNDINSTIVRLGINYTLSKFTKNG